MIEINPIPEVEISRVIGLLEIIDDAGGQNDIFKLAREINYEFGELVLVLKAAEILEFVTLTKGDVILGELGKKLLKSRVGARKKIMKEQLIKLGLFQALTEMLKRAKDNTVDQDTVFEQLVLFLPDEDYEKLFHTIVNWGRYAELFGYSPETKQLYLIVKK